MARFIEIETPRFRGEPRKSRFELKYAENGALLMLHADGEDKGEIFHHVGGEEGLEYFVEETLMGEILSDEGEIEEKPKHQGVDVPGFGYIPLPPFSDDDFDPSI